MCAPLRKDPVDKCPQGADAPWKPCADSNISRISRHIRGRAQRDHQLDARLRPGQVLAEDDAQVAQHLPAAFVAVGGSDAAFRAARDEHHRDARGEGGAQAGQARRAARCRSRWPRRTRPRAPRASDARSSASSTPAAIVCRSTSETRRARWSGGRAEGRPLEDDLAAIEDRRAGRARCGTRPGSACATWWPRRRRGPARPRPRARRARAHRDGRPCAPPSSGSRDRPSPARTPCAWRRRRRPACRSRASGRAGTPSPRACRCRA